METELALTKEQRAELRREWIADLRSGKFKQGNQYLERDDKSCCLGVLCRTFDRMFPGVLKINPSPLTTTESGVIAFDTWTGLLPETVMEAIGMKDDGGEMDDRKALYELNDAGTPFSEIADIIESNPPGLFVEER